MSKTLDLGSGPTPKNPFNAIEIVGVDVEASPGVYHCALGYEPIPFPDATFDYCSAFDLIEHIPRTGRDPKSNPFIYLMNEIYRILKPNGLFYAKTPAFPYPTCFSDPTHVNYITPETLNYFSYRLNSDKSLIADPRINLWSRYGFRGQFATHENRTDESYGHQIWLIQAIK
jgi:SAM-dependent methyltransferase